ncbi:DUF4139 domain-containing protein [Acidovorax sp. NCPPB 4044]|uniref:DUF4139 domain-containing protein n=1 Tax=Acidovorax sp. NCPPB 4044 TaxID=2940490 RepID=UPI002302FCF7|nr:DUF4139 domain-containing protein [Acidovorax sp. NCPPB 4044]MDA8522855.1 DUF4139 domain-containing protein [Acidovorax sp. NCPPB 4044]
MPLARPRPPAAARPTPFPWPRPAGATALRRALPVLAACAAFGAAAQEPPPVASRITQVTVAPGIATVERSARIAAGARGATFACLPASLDPDSLQIGADAGVRVGEFKVTTEDRDVAAGCASPLDDRIRALEDQIANVQAEIAALRRVDRYLNHVAGGGTGSNSAGAHPAARDGQGGAAGASATPLPTPAAQIPATAEALRKTSADTLVRLPPLQRRQEALERELKPLRTERDRAAGGPRGKVVSVAVHLATDREAELRLTYQVRGPGWQPGYRARLDTATGAVVLERLAVVAQRSGEDWSNVRLALTTQAPARATQGPRPGTWTLDVAAPPEPQRRLERLSAPMPAPAPAPAALAAPAGMAEEPLPDFDVAALEGSYATRFEVPQRLTVPASGQRTTLLLGMHNASARLVTRTVPAQQETAYLVAEIAPPAGPWPAGPVGLYRDGAFVGQGRLDFAAATAAGGAAAQEARTVPLWFGPDDLVRVQAEAPQQTTGTAGLTGARVEQRTVLAYRIDNRHTTPITLQVIDAAPVSRNTKIEVESRYTPAPLTTAWEGRAGTTAWQQTLAPGAGARFTAEHTVRHAKDIELNETKP